MKKTSTARKESKSGMLLLGDASRMTKENKANCVFVALVHKCDAPTPMLKLE